MTPDEFVARWENTTLTERAAAQSHFIDLCRLLQVSTPIEADPQGDFYTFEQQTSKDTGHRGFADVWYKEHFAWEYKKPQRDLWNETYRDPWIERVKTRTALRNYMTKYWPGLRSLLKDE